MSNNNSYGDNEICYAETVDPTHLWGINISPLKDPVPQLVIQMALAVAVNHGFLFIFQRFGQPRFVSNMMTALLLSPSTLSKIHHNLGELLLPTKSLTILETIANLGLLYATFIEALQANDIPISQTKPKMVCHSLLVFICPFFVGYALYLAIKNFIKEDSTISNNIIDVTSIYWGTIITSTRFTSIAPILSKLKLLCTYIGQEALFIGLFNDFCTWLLINIILAISTSPSNHNKINLLATSIILLSMVIYMVFCCTLIKPTISKIITLTNDPESENYSNFAAQMILFLVLASGFLTDYIGSHFIFGAYILGRCVPPGILGDTIIEKMEECVDGVLMPLYFVMIGIKLDIFKVISNIMCTSWVIALAIATKVLCTLITGVFCNVSLGHSFPLGVLLSTKGLLPLVLLNVGHERGVITSESFTILYLIMLLSTILAGPIMSVGYKRIRKSNQSNDERILQGAEFSKTLQLITCIYSSRNIPSIMNLLEISNITPEYPALVHVTHLVELVGHASTMLIEHEPPDSFFCANLLSSKIFFDRTRVRSNQIIKAFNEYIDEHNAIKGAFKVLTVVSPFDTMHEDICSLAEDKKTSLIILPFHKQQGVDGMLEDVEIEFGCVNQKVLEMAPCSVALLVDRGLRITSSSLALDNNSLRSIGSGRECVQIAMVYIGGPDDREALTYAWRMVLGQQSCVNLTLIQFFEGDHVMDVDQVTDYLEWCNGNNEVDIANLYSQKERENQVDNDFLQDFEQQTADDDAICYLKYEVNNGDELMDLLRDMNDDYHLYIIGRGKFRFSLLTLGLVDWNECKELGIIGNVLISSDFTSNASVLVIQQYASDGVNQQNFEDKCSEEENDFVNSYHEP